MCVIAATPQGEALLKLRVRWSLAVGSDHMIGCQFIQASDFALLRKMQPGVNEKDRLHEHSRGGKPTRDGR